MRKPSPLTTTFIAVFLSLTAGCELIQSFTGGGEDVEVVPPQEAPQSPGTPPSTNPFGDAVRKATSAAQLAQTAKTPPEWQAVANDWQAAIDLMNAVPEGDPNKAVAQQKAVEYQKNLEYAQKNAGG